MGNFASTARAQELKALRHSAEIDRIIEEDSRRSKQEHKILFLGKGWPLSLTLPARDADANDDRCRVGRVWKVDCSQANEIPPPGRFLTRRTHCLPDHDLPKLVGKRAGSCLSGA